jgi:hypothetical protein
VIDGTARDGRTSGWEQWLAGDPECGEFSPLSAGDTSPSNEVWSDSSEP